MNAMWETYFKNHRGLGLKRLAEYKREYKIDLKKAYETALVEDQFLLAFALDEIMELKAEIKKLKKAVTSDE